MKKHRKLIYWLISQTCSGQNWARVNPGEFKSRSVLGRNPTTLSHLHCLPESTLLQTSWANTEACQSRHTVYTCHQDIHKDSRRIWCRFRGHQRGVLRPSPSMHMLCRYSLNTNCILGAESAETKSNRHSPNLRATLSGHQHPVFLRLYLNSNYGYTTECFKMYQ